MFHNIPEPVRARMEQLEEIDRKDRKDGTGWMHRLRQVPPETGRFIAVLSACAPPGTHLDVGTSGGYSALWLTLACREAGRKLVTFELLEDKVRLAAGTFREAGVEDIVKLVKGDARELLSQYHDVSFCFLDPVKEHYSDCYSLIVPNLVKGGLLVADNLISHRDELQLFLRMAMNDSRVDSIAIPIGNGLLVSRKL